jgi:N-acetyl-gamma-glutamyl-phosphate reductase
MASGATIEDLRRTLEGAYEGEAFVRVLPKGQVPATHHVRGSNLCLIGLAQDRLSGRAILVSALDNLVKGASGQAVQDMNVMLGIPETSGLQQEPLFP